jgi:galactokinase
MFAHIHNEQWLTGLRAKFKLHWADSTNVRFFQAPGRVNLIGEHTDYNEGFVLPLALNYSTTVVIQKRDDDLIEAYSENFQQLKSFNLKNPGEKKTDTWMNYVEGVIRVLQAKNFEISGANLFIDSDVPVGAGLSSSAAIESAVAFAISTVNNLNISKLEIALTGQQAEHEYVGTKSGIMDQFVSVFGRAGHALLIDCRTLEGTPVSLDLKETDIVVCNSGIKHELATSGYNQRRGECEEGVRALKKYLPAISSLRDVNIKEFDKYSKHLPEAIKRRCRHVITENQRTLDAVKALQTGDLQLAGKLMSDSHKSLRDDFEVSCDELDLLVSLSDEFSGVYGARMTGGGFGGSIISLVKRQNTDEFISHLKTQYQAKTKYIADAFCVTASDGVSEMEISENIKMMV